jgi:hypothetical protein
MKADNASVSGVVVPIEQVQKLYDRHRYLDAFALTADCWHPSFDIPTASIDQLLLAGRLAARLGGCRLSRWLFRAALAREPRNLKGAKTSSRCQDVLPNDTAETVTTNNASATDSCRRIHRTAAFRRRERQRSMRPVPVIVIDEYPQDPLKVRPVPHRSQSRHSLRALCTKRSATALACGARNGVRTIAIRSLRKTSSNRSVNSDPDYESKTVSVPNGPPAPTTRAAPAG